MTAPHFHTTAEARAAINKIEHNMDEGKPTGISGGSASNKTTKTPGVTSNAKGDDWVSGSGKK